jgi:hypothetical protein
LLVAVEELVDEAGSWYLLLEVDDDDGAGVATVGFSSGFFFLNLSQNGIIKWRSLKSVLGTSTSKG